MTLPAELAVGETLSWSVTCDGAKWLGATSAKQLAKHDGLTTGSLLAVRCRDPDDPDELPAPWVPVDPLEPVQQARLARRSRRTVAAPPAGS